MGPVIPSESHSSGQSAAGTDVVQDGTSSGACLTLPFINMSLMQTANQSLTSLDDMPVQMYNTRIVMRNSDYLAFLSVAMSISDPSRTAMLLDSCHDQQAKDIAQQYSRYRVSVDSMTPINGQDFSQGFKSQIVFGDVWMGRLISLMPEAPLSPEVLSSCLARYVASPSSSSSNSTTPSTKLVIGLSVAIPIALALITVIAAAVWFARQKKRRYVNRDLCLQRCLKMCVMESFCTACCRLYTP